MLVLAGAAPQVARAQQKPDVSVAEGATLKLEVLAQPQSSSTRVDSVVETDFELRRARLTAEGQLVL
jgi:hypothetical protein